MLKVTPSKETLTAWQNRPQKVVASYIKKVLELSASKANGQIRTATVIYFIREHKLNLYEKVALYRLIGSDHRLDMLKLDYQIGGAIYPPFLAVNEA